MSVDLHTEKVRTQTANEPFEEGLACRGRHDAVRQPRDSIVHIPKRPCPDLHEAESDERNQDNGERYDPDGQSLSTEWVRKLRVDDCSSGRLDRE